MIIAALLTAKMITEKATSNPTRKPYTGDRTCTVSNPYAAMKLQHDITCWGHLFWTNVLITRDQKLEIHPMATYPKPKKSNTFDASSQIHSSCQRLHPFPGNSATSEGLPCGSPPGFWPWSKTLTSHPAKGLSHVPFSSCQSSFPFESFWLSPYSYCLDSHQ